MRVHFLPLVFFTLTGLALKTSSADEPRSKPPSQPVAIRSAQTNVAAPAAGRKVFVDPATGKILPGPKAPAVALPPEAQNAHSTSGEGLREVPTRARAGGIKVDLQGRFQSAVTTTIGPDGKVATRCQTAAEADPGSGRK